MSFNVKNFSFSEVVGAYGAADVSITVEDAADLPVAPFYATWWNTTNYQVPDDDPYKEIVLCTVKTGNVLTVTRGQDDTTATAKNLSGRVYRLDATLTAAMINSLKALLLEDMTGALIKIGAVSYEMYAEMEDGIPTLRLRLP